MIAAVSSSLKAARSAGVFAMEAMWTRYLPQSDAIRLLCKQGALGDIELVTADHGQALADHPASRLLRADLGGGALLDLGVYPVTLAHLFLGPPDEIRAWARIGPQGTDQNTAMIFGYASGRSSAV